MKITSNKVAPAKYEVEVEVDSKLWKEAQEKSLDKEIAKVHIDGFRPGKAPKELAKKHVDPAKVLDGAINDSLNPVFREVLKETKLVPFTQPSVDVTKVSDTELTLKFSIITTPEVELGTYKGLNVEKEVPAVNEEEVEASIKKLVENNANLVLAERPSQKGDTVVIDFEGSVDGVPFDGGKAENYSLELGSNTFIPGFEDQLIGKSAEEEVEVKVTFPKQYVETLAGKDAIFKVKVHEVKEKVLPELDEELIKELNIEGVKTVDELKAHERAHILEQKEQQAKGHALDAILDKIVEGSKIELPEEAVKERIHEMRHETENRLNQQGLDFKQYLDITGLTEEKWEEQVKGDAQKQVTASAVLSKIIEAEKLTVTDEEVDAELNKMAEQYKMEVEKIREILKPQLASFKNDLLNRKLQEFLLENNLKK